MHLFICLLALAAVVYHVRARRLPTPRRIVALLVVLYAITAFWAGFHLAMVEDALGRYGAVVSGTIDERISTTGEQGTRSFGTHLPAAIITSEGSEFYELLQRRVATGSTSAWAVDYRYPCGSAQRCRGRAFLSHDRWLRTHAGDQVKVRYANGALGGSRLDEASQWPAAIARMAIGTSLLAAAVLLWGTNPAFPRTRRAIARAVVNTVEEVRYLGGCHWRVHFSYLDGNGKPHEGCDEFATDGWQPGDIGVAVYEPATPEVAGLRRERAPGSGLRAQELSGSRP